MFKLEVVTDTKTVLGRADLQTLENSEHPIEFSASLSKKHLLLHLLLLALSHCSSLY
jgi:hypothetical protein